VCAGLGRRIKNSVRNAGFLAFLRFRLQWPALMLAAGLCIYLAIVALATSRGYP
jgi:hypothetical protein